MQMINVEAVAQSLNHVVFLFEPLTVDMEQNTFDGCFWSWKNVTYKCLKPEAATGGVL